MLLKILAIAAVVLVVGVLALRFGLRLLMRRIAASPEYQARIARYTASREREETLVEQADWFGTTGLSDEDERELPRYLRREFGELIEDEGALQAQDLRYVGRFEEGRELAHYWRIPSRSEDEPTYACVSTDREGVTSFEWGSRQPPIAAPNAFPPIAPA
jgi:hypothetical protein